MEQLENTLMRMPQLHFAKAKLGGMQQYFIHPQKTVNSSESLLKLL